MELTSLIITSLAFCAFCYIWQKYLARHFNWAIVFALISAAAFFYLGFALLTYTKEPLKNFSQGADSVLTQTVTTAYDIITLQPPRK